MSTTVVVIDDHALFRKGVTQMLASDAEFTVIGEHVLGLDGTLLVKHLKPDLVLIDPNIKAINGLQTLISIKQEEKNTRCIVLTASDDRANLLDAFRAGADGYLLKDMRAEALCDHLKKAMSGTMVLDESLAEILKDALLNPPNGTNEEESLTEREKEILVCLADGLNNKKIARTLGICETTVKVHVKHVLIKLNLSSRLQAAVWAHKRKLAMS